MIINHNFSQHEHKLLANHGIITMTEQLRDKIIKSSTRCTQATLKAFGVEGYPLFRSGLLDYFKNSGFNTRELKDLKGKTLRYLEFYISTRGKGYNCSVHTKNHAMALINGILVDTTLKGFDGRKIENIWIVGRL